MTVKKEEIKVGENGPDWEKFESGVEGQQKPEDVEQQQQQQQQQQSSTGATIWDWFKSQDDTFVIPQEVADKKIPEGKTEQDYVKEVLKTKFFKDEFEQKDQALTNVISDPFVKDYLDNKSKENFDINAWISEKVNQGSFDKMSDEEFAKFYFNTYELKSEKNPDGFTPEEIEDKISKMKDLGMLKLNVKAMKNDHNAAIYQQQKQAYDTYQKQMIEEEKKAEEAYYKNITEVIEKVKKEQDFFGIKVGEAEMNDFTSKLKHIFTYNDKGQRPFDAILSDDVLVAKMLFHALKGDYVKSYITDLKESMKEEIENKLGAGQKPGGGGGSSTVIGADWDKFAQTEQT
jgi:hypothetical protein